MLTQNKKTTKKWWVRPSRVIEFPPKQSFTTDFHIHAVRRAPGIFHSATRDTLDREWRLSVRLSLPSPSRRSPQSLSHGAESSEWRWRFRSYLARRRARRTAESIRS